MTNNEFLDFVYEKYNEKYGCEWDDCIFAPPCEDEDMVNILIRHFLGEIWYLDSIYEKEVNYTKFIYCIVDRNKGTGFYKNGLDFLDRISGGIGKKIMEHQYPLPICRAGDARQALVNQFLGPDFYTYNPISSSQINTEFCYEILSRYLRIPENLNIIERFLYRVGVIFQFKNKHIVKPMSK